MVRRRLIVRGRVQGVWYRDSCRVEAERLGLAGSARNLADGTVEVVAEGDDHSVDQLVAWCRAGSPGAAVTGVEIADEPPTGEKGFRVDW